MRAQIIRNINPDMAAVEEFCRRWHIAELGLFGSVLRDYFADNSDVDVLITYEEDMTLDRFDRLRAQDELSGILGRKVDWVTREAVAWWSTPGVYATTFSKPSRPSIQRTKFLSATLPYLFQCRFWNVGQGALSTLLV